MCLNLSRRVVRNALTFSVRDEFKSSGLSSADKLAAEATDRVSMDEIRLRGTANE